MEIYINNQWLNITNTSQGPSGDTQGSMDNDPVLINLMDNLWTQTVAYKNSPNDLNTQDFMQSVNAVMGYFTKNGNPDPKLDPQTYAVFQALTNPLANLLAVCAEYGTSNSASAVAELESATGQSLIAGVNTAIGHNFNQPSSQNQSSQVQQAFDYLLGDIKAYNWDMGMPPSERSPARLQGDLNAISADLIALNTAMQGVSGGLSDGYLSALSLMLNTPVTAANGQTLLQLSQAVLRILETKQI